MSPGPHDVYQHLSPMFHSTDLKAAVVTLFGGGHAYLKAFSAEGVLAAVARHRVTILSLVPTMIVRLLREGRLADHDLTSLRLVSYGTVSGECQMNTDNMPQLVGQIKAGKVGALAVTSPTRWYQVPEPPTVTELGYPALTCRVWFGVVAQASCPRPIVMKMNEAMQAALTDPEFKARLRENGLQADPSTPGQMAALAAKERERWRKVVEVSGASLE